MHLSLKGSLKSSLIFTYVKTDQALDLGNLEPFTIPDLSDNANTATLYSGIYVSTNGTMDKAINANCSAAGVGRYRLRGKVRASSVGFVVFTLNGLGTGSGSYYIDVADTWQDFEPSPLNSITPSNVILGFNGSSSYSAADFSAMRLEKEIGGEWVNVAHWKLYDSADASLDGYPALDCVGGFHGAHVGCAGGSGEGVDADVAGISATLDDYMWFGGVDDYVAVSGMAATTNYFGACTIEATIYVTDLTSVQAVFALGSACYRLFISSSGTFGLNTTDTLVPAVMGVQTVAVDFNASGVATALRVNGVTEWTGTAAVGTATNTFYIGTRNSGGLGLFYKGLVYDFSLSGSSVKNFAFTGDELVTWTDTTGNGNNGTVNGNPVTVGQKRETILQTAGEDFNRGENILLYSEDVLNASVWTVNAAYSTTLTLPVTGPNGDTVNAIHLKKTFGAGRRIDQAAPASAFTIFAWVRAGDYGTIKNTFVFGVRTGANPSVSIISGVGSVAAPVSGGVTISGLSAASWTLVKATYTGSPSEFYIQQGAGGDTGSCYVYQLQATASSDYADNVYLTTEANALENVFIPESETTAGQDALGNAIENPRPNERVLNLTTGTGYATVADNDSLDLGTSSLVTHEFWIKIEDGSVNHRIIDKASSVNGIGLQYISSISSIRVTFRTQSNSTSTWDGATDIADGQWHHIIVRLNNRQTTPVAGDVSILIDGADDSATLFNSASNLTATLTNAEPLHIGFNDDFPTQKLVGQIGDVRQYDRALTADEVLKNYNARKGAYGL
jgi:hypothetical protein